MSSSAFTGKLLLLIAVFCASTRAEAQVHLWLTDFDKAVFFQEQPDCLAFGASDRGLPTIEVDESQTFQSIDGFGCCLTGGSADLLMRMDAAARATLLRELFASDGTNIGISYLRVSIGASDLNPAPFSYDDMPAGQIDPTLSRFTLAPDVTTVIPILREILAINPAIKILGSPWSAPAWMKDNADTRGGRLRPEFYDAYARYFVDYIEGMEAQGIRIDAVTIQNEPLNGRNNPSMVMSAPEQAAFVKNNLGPAFRAARLATKIIIYDHNCDHPEFPISMLDDPAVSQYVDGSAFHLYGGRIDALSRVHNAHPDKALYFTEQWTGAYANPRTDFDWHIQDVVIGSTRNWSRVALQWNLAADPHYEPHTDRGGCDSCLGAITIDGNNVSRHTAYYVMAHTAKFVRPGSVRIASNNLSGLPNAAFRAPDGRKVLLVLNNAASPRTFDIRFGGRLAETTLNAGAVGTYVW